MPFADIDLFQVQTAADGGKHDDTGAMKSSMIKLIPHKCLPDVGRDNDANTAESYLKDIRAPYLNKAWRGFNNILTATLLCPVEHLATMRADPEESVSGPVHPLRTFADCTFRTRMQLIERKLSLVDSDGDPKLPFFLYDQDLMDGSVTQGLLRGPFLLAVCTLSHTVPCPWNAIDHVYLGLPAYLYIAICCGRGEVIIKAWKRENSRYDRGYAFNNLLCRYPGSCHLLNPTFTPHTDDLSSGLCRIMFY